jgi:tight adherence protein C
MEKIMPVTLSHNEVVTAASFLAAGSLVVFVWMMAGLRGGAVRRRLTNLPRSDAPAGPTAAPAKRQNSVFVARPAMEVRINRRLQQEQKKDSIEQRMLHAGFYGASRAATFLLLRVGLLAGPAAAGVVVSRVGKLPLTQSVLFGAIAGMAGTLLPGMWLDHVKRARQTKIRRSLPDALDVMAVCLQGGLSLGAALARVARELAVAHPTLAVELTIIERQIHMGRTVGDAIRRMADRLDLEELRSMASVIAQAERIGASVAKALEVFAEDLRVKRHQRAEELAHKAAVKMLAPTVLFIFPAMFVVLLGPAAIQIYRQLILGALSNH